MQDLATRFAFTAVSQQPGFRENSIRKQTGQTEQAPFPKTVDGCHNCPELTLSAFDQGFTYEQELQQWGKFQSTRAFHEGASFRSENATRNVCGLKGDNLLIKPDKFRCGHRSDNHHHKYIDCAGFN